MVTRTTVVGSTAVGPALLALALPTAAAVRTSSSAAVRTSSTAVRTAAEAREGTLDVGATMDAGLGRVVVTSCCSNQQRSPGTAGGTYHQMHP